MQYFDYRITGENRETIYKILSACLPHENFDEEYARSGLEELFRTVPIEETSGIMYIFFKAFRNMQVIKMYMNGFKNVLRRESFDAAVQGGVTQIVKDEAFRAKDFFEEYGQKFNLEIPQEYSNALSFVYTEAMAVYDELYEMAIPSHECETWVKILKEALEADLTRQLFSLGGKALAKGVVIDRQMYKGAEAARRLLHAATSEVDARITMMHGSMTDINVATPITSFESSKTFDQKNAFKVRDLYYMGFEPIDDHYTVRTPDIITIIADEGVGKTRFAVDQAYKALVSGCNVHYVCGETSILELKKRIEAQHIFNMYGEQFSPRELMDFDRLPITDMDKLDETIVKINNATRDLYENPKHGTLVLQQSVFYETFAQSVRKYHEAYKTDIVFVDHVLAMQSNGDMTPMGRLINKQARVTYLFQQEDMLVKELNVSFFNTSHPSTHTSEELRKGLKPSSRAGAESAESSRYASFIGILTTNDQLKRQDMIILYVNKIRSDAPITDAIVLSRNGYGNHHEYRRDIQQYAQQIEPLSEGDTMGLIDDEFDME